MSNHEQDGPGSYGTPIFGLPSLAGEPRPGEEVRDGSHGDNRGGDNRGGVAPTAAPLRPQVGPGLSGSGLYRALRPSRVVPLHQG